MTTTLAEPPAWSRRRWGLTILAAVAVQTTLIFWLGNNSPLVPRTARNEPRVSLAPSYPAELAELDNPTLFTRGDARGFSGLAWEKLPRPRYRAAEWTEPPRFLGLRPEQLAGGVVRQLVQNNTPPPLQIAGKPEPTIDLPELPSPEGLMPAQSELRVEGGLAGRTLLAPLTLPSWPSVELFSNTVVRVVVAADGHTQSAALLFPGSGSAEADQKALALAKTVRFDSLRGRGPDRPTPKVPGIAWGNLIFVWHTFPPPATNAPASKP